MALFRVVWEYTALVMNDIHLPVPARWISFMTRAVYSHTTLNAIQYYILLIIVALLVKRKEKKIEHNNSCPSQGNSAVLQFCAPPAIDSGEAKMRTASWENVDK